MTALTHRQSRALILAVHYKTQQDVVSLLASLYRLQQCEELQTIIVDNASGVEHLSEIQRAITPFPNAALMELSSNLGYLGAARVALDRYTAAGERLPDWIIVSNCDIVVADDAFLQKLFARDPVSVGMIAPRIVVPRFDLDQNPFLSERPGRLRRFTMRLHSRNYFFCLAWNWLFRVKRILRSAAPSANSRRVPAANARPTTIYAPHGSFMIFSRRFFEAGGYLDDQLFLFGEEIAAGEICRRLRLPVVYDPALSVVHNEHRSVGSGMTPEKFRHHRESTQRVLAEYLTSQSV
jgi:GT2 family glycosyltransferase